MKKLINFALIMSLTACVGNNNPFLSEKASINDAIDFNKIESKHYLPAFKAGFKQQKEEITAIANNPDVPTFENTIEELEASGSILNRVSGVFYNLNETDADDIMKETEKVIIPLMSEQSTFIYMNNALFQRIKTLYDSLDTLNLTREQERTVEKYYRDFVDGGALLNDEQKKRLEEINTRLNLLSVDFSNHVLDETNAYSLHITDEKEIKGLPDDVMLAASERAKEKGLDGWIFNIQKPCLIPFLQFCENRTLRKQMYEAYYSRGNNDNEFDNKSIIKEILQLRFEKARLLGYDTFADYQLSDKMAATPGAAYDLLMDIWKVALPQANKERDEMQSIIDSEGGDFKLEAWDWWYYAEKLRKLKYDLNENELKQYFTLENARKGSFYVAEKLFGIHFVKIDSLPKYQSTVECYECLDSDNTHLAYFYTDCFVRDTKHQGAWMNNFVSAENLKGRRIYPSVVNVCNFYLPDENGQALLSIDDVRTVFHEFGHALHGMLTKVSYPRIGGTNVPTDFVELCSQVMEHWAIEPSIMKQYAFNYKTGEPIPDSLIAKMQNAGHFNTGFETVELVGAALLDMEYHMQNDNSNFDDAKFEDEISEKIGMIDEIEYRYRGTFFSHIFSNGYSAGYYSYLWAEVLDADAFECFKENGILDEATGRSFRKNILEKGNSEDLMVLYKRFRGSEPSTVALLKNRGLAE